MKYRKKPVVIEAVQWKGDNWNDICDFVGIPTNGQGKFGANGEMEIAIWTLEGEMTASIGDYIIKGVQGEFYPCKPDIFESTYDSIEQGDDNGTDG
ncbi:hypothetical protein [Halobacillus ihumii]|uniref:hypothetical protein n=1 Tax=Halobacillus ihumii TaxID=2686092 RepID=UPI0013D71079|nr:hypothetical protein [Halobacillus ihumii]